MEQDPDKTNLVTPMPFDGPDTTSQVPPTASADPDRTSLLAPPPGPPTAPGGWQPAPQPRRTPPPPAQWAPPPAAPPAQNFGQGPDYGNPGTRQWSGSQWQPGAPAPQQQPGPMPGQQPWNPAPPAAHDPSAMGFGGPPQPPTPQGYNPYGAPAQPGFTHPGQPAPGFGAPQPGAPFGPPGAPYSTPMNPQQTPVEMAKSALNKSGSFIFRTMSQGVRGELIKQPWFQNMRSNAQGANQIAYIGTGIWALLAVLFTWGGGVIGVIISAVLGLALIYVLLALGTKTGAQCAAYGVCGIGIAGLLYLIVSGVLGIIRISNLPDSPYMPSTSGYTAELVIGIVFFVVIGAAAGYVCAQIQSGMKKIASGQF